MTTVFRNSACNISVVEEEDNDDDIEDVASEITRKFSNISPECQAARRYHNRTMAELDNLIRMLRELLVDRDAKIFIAGKISLWSEVAEDGPSETLLSQICNSHDDLRGREDFIRPFKESLRGLPTNLFVRPVVAVPVNVMNVQADSATSSLSASTDNNGTHVHHQIGVVAPRGSAIASGDSTSSSSGAASEGDGGQSDAALHP